jgi:hypothetical protein
MEGVRPVQLPQDENSSALLGRTLGAAKSHFGGGDAKFGKGTPAANAKGLSSARKAFGNITNQGPAHPSSVQPSKTSANAPATARKALGDITNSAKPSQEQQQGTGQPKAEKPSASIDEAVAAERDRLAELYAKDGVEKLAGKGWKELQADMEARENAEIMDRLLRIVNPNRPYITGVSMRRWMPRPFRALPATEGVHLRLL